MEAALRAAAVPRVSVSENHDQALYTWREAGVHQRVLVHIDAHHDMWWIDDTAAITIADFICPALKQDLVRELFCVVPDQAFASPSNRRQVLRHLHRLLKTYPRSSARPTEGSHTITASILGKNLTVCPLRHLPPIPEPVLLDIDVDYLVIPRVSYGEPDRHSAIPWRRPAELVQQLQELPVHLATVSYSVEGGYTPLAWKYLGDELALRLQRPPDAPEWSGFAKMNQAEDAQARGDSTASESNYRQAMALMPSSAAPPYNLARLLLKLGREQEARSLYQQAVSLDATYRGPYSSQGFPLLAREQWQAAAAEFRELQALDPSDPYPHLGLGLIARHRRQWDDAERYLRGALALNPRLIDAQIALGELSASLGRKTEAVEAYETALKLGLLGNKPLAGCILTHAPANRLMDPSHCHTYVRLASLYEQQGAIAKAVNALRIAIAGGEDGVGIRLRLARLYARQKRWSEGIQQLSEVRKVLPQGARRAAAGISRWFRHKCQTN